MLAAVNSFTSSAAVGRLAGSLANMWSTSRTSATGVSGSRSDTLGMGAEMCFAITSVALRPGKGHVPVSIS